MSTNLEHHNRIVICVTVWRWHRILCGYCVPSIEILKPLILDRPNKSTKFWVPFVFGQFLRAKEGALASGTCSYRGMSFCLEEKAVISKTMKKQCTGGFVWTNTILKRKKTSLLLILNISPSSPLGVNKLTHLLATQNPRVREPAGETLNTPNKRPVPEYKAIPEGTGKKSIYRGCYPRVPPPPLVSRNTLIGLLNGGGTLFYTFLNIGFQRTQHKQNTKTFLLLWVMKLSLPSLNKHSCTQFWLFLEDGA